MTTRTMEPVRRGTSTTTIAGWVCFAGGLLGAAQGVFMLVVPPVVPIERFSYPLTPTGYVLVELSFAVQHLLLVVGMVAFMRSPWSAGSRLARIGFGIAAAALLLLAAVEIFALTAANVALEDPRAVLVSTLYGPPTVLVGVGLTLAGIGVARSSGLSGWQRWLPLATGAFVFVPLLPAVFAPYVYGRVALTVWMLMFAALGWMLVHRPKRRDP